MENEKIAIVGAGVAGLLLARELKAAGRDVVVLEKSRGLGGRLATKRVEAAVFDQGAQYFTAQTARFAELVAAWRDRGVVTQWPGASAHRWIVRPSMNAIGRVLAEGLEVNREAKVLSVRRDRAEWEIAIEGQAALRTGQLALTAPTPQALALLVAGGVELPAELTAGLAALQYHSCLALLVTLDGPSAVPPVGIAFATGPVRWLADNRKKGISSGANAAVTVHLNPEFSAKHYAKTEAELAPLVLPGIAEQLGAPVTGVALHRWKFSEPSATFSEPCVWRPKLGLGLAGDAFGGPRVEGAAVSAWALADKILGEPEDA
ncbi:MAG: NAD(P)-binding protein [Opitutaceae bacterium]